MDLHCQRLSPPKEAPSLWNKLPTEIRNEDNFEHFKSKLKTFLFRAAYAMKKRDLF